VLVSTGGFIERELVQGATAVRKYVAECKKLGFDIIEISAGFVSIPTDDWLRLIELVRKSGLKAKPEVGIQFGAGGATAAAELQAEGTRDPNWAIAQAKRFLDAGAEILMIENEGITENVDPSNCKSITGLPPIVHALYSNKIRSGASQLPGPAPYQRSAIFRIKKPVNVRQAIKSRKQAVSTPNIFEKK